MDPRHCGVTGNELADHVAKKGAACIQQTTRKAVPFTSANKRIIKKKMNDLTSVQYTEGNSNKIWWNNLKIFPSGQDVKQLPSFIWLLDNRLIEFMLHNPLSAHSVIFGRTWMLTTFAASQH
ncbi:hypothetical protein TNCV_2513041 [Trichonephila clavipes]|nr:hypothetical protein TNCV_2513041 [Trichonephila clavipes]